MIDEQTRMHSMIQVTKLFDDIARRCNDNTKLAESKLMFERIVIRSDSYGLNFKTDLSLFDIMFLIKARHELEVEKEKERRANCECCHE